MPLYRFVCKFCGNVREVLQAFGDPSPYCGACSPNGEERNEMKRTICATNFTLKGDGWARDNYGLKKK